MRHPRLVLSFTVLALGLAACSESSTSPVAPRRPRFDAGPTIGSGSNEAAPDSTTLGTKGAGPTIGSGS